MSSSLDPDWISMTHSQCSSGPLYFFQQSVTRPPDKHRLLFNRCSGNQRGDEGEPTSDPSSSVGRNQNPLDRLKTRALLDQLTQQLSLHAWTELRCLPRGIENILDYCSQGTFSDKLRTGGDASRALVGRGHVRKCENKTHSWQKPTTEQDESSCFSCDSTPGRTVCHRRDSPERTLCRSAGLRRTRGPDLQTVDMNHQRSLILRYYGDAKVPVKDPRVKRASLAIQEVKQQSRKLHYGLGDGSAFIYYPSGHMAVCQSCSGQASGGFYTNVFSDGARPVVLASITMFGRGAVTLPVSGTIAAAWDRDGGFLLDPNGNVSEEWSWRKGRHEVVVKVSELISVQLLSGTSAVLRFKCEGERVRLPLKAISVDKETLPQVVGEVEETPVRWRRGRADGEMLKLEQRVRTIMDDWSRFYRDALGVRCPRRESRPRREEESLVLPSLNQVQLVHLSRCRSGQASRERAGERRRDRLCRVTRKGPLVIYGDIKPESLIISEVQSSAAPCPVQSAFGPPLTLCPPMLRAALLGEEEMRTRRCCCSPAVMPLLTDLEYDHFILGQPPHSQQILVVCLTRPVAADEPDSLEQLHRRKNRNRSRPCTQCQTDSFRLVRYEVSPEKLLLQRRHRVAPGMLLMYLRGILLFVGNIFSDPSWSLEQQISKSRREHRSGLSLSSEFKLRDEQNSTQDSRLVQEDGETTQLHK